MDPEPSFHVAKFVYECMEYRKSEDSEALLWFVIVSAVFLAMELRWLRLGAPLQSVLFCLGIQPSRFGPSCWTSMLRHILRELTSYAIRLHPVCCYTSLS
jgi:hypothetical protein